MGYPEGVLLVFKNINVKNQKHRIVEVRKYKSNSIRASKQER